MSDFLKASFMPMEPKMWPFYSLAILVNVCPSVFPALETGCEFRGRTYLRGRRDFRFPDRSGVYVTFMARAV